MKKYLIATAALAAALPAAHAVDIKAGDWTVNVGGNINAFYTGSSCNQPAGTVAGLALGDATLACDGKSKSTTVGNGLLPSMLMVGATTAQDGYDIAAMFGIGVATGTNTAVGQNNVVDVRHAYLTFGNKDMGTVKLGRDYGLFGLNSVVSDMTLLGVGAATRATQNGRVSLGHLAAGYAYPGTYGQLAYSTPNMGGFTFDIGVFNPVDTTLGNGQVASDSAQVQARAVYAGKGFKVWVAAKNQQFGDGSVPNPLTVTGGIVNPQTFTTTPGFSMNGTEIGGSLTLGALGLVANYQSGNGLGMLSDGDQGDVKTKHAFVQATYQVTAKTKLGLGYGKSENDRNITINANNLLSNENTTAGLYYSLTKSITLVGEIGATKSKAFNDATATQNSVALGGIFFF